MDGYYEPVVAEVVIIGTKKNNTIKLVYNELYTVFFNLFSFTAPCRPN
jgi:hypothetical protein